MISGVIDVINNELAKLFEKFTGSRMYGLAESVTRTDGDITKKFPSLIDSNGEGQYVGIDNTVPVIIYHKSNSVQITSKANSGFGDAVADKVYTYNNSMIVFQNRKQTKLLPDELLLFIQSNLPDSYKLSGFKMILIRLQSAVMNTQQVFASEYQNTDYRLHLENNMIAINYQVEATINCLPRCP